MTTPTIQKIAEGRNAGWQCSFCKRKAVDSVSDENDFFPCCRSCFEAWQLDPGFMKDTRRKEPDGQQVRSYLQEKGR